MEQIKSIRILSGVEDFERQIAEGKIDPVLADHILKDYKKKSKNLRRPGTRARMSEQEKLFVKHLPKFKLKPSGNNFISIQAILEDEGIVMQKTTIQKYIQKYRPR